MLSRLARTEIKVVWAPDELVYFLSSQLVLSGAESTRLYAMRFGADVLPSAIAFRVVTRRVETRRAHLTRRNTYESKKHQ
jgi:hypothetical protein